MTLALAGCSLLPAPLGLAREARARLRRRPPWRWRCREATERFELAPDQDIVGHVQITTSTKEDTLTDIARRFNVGYEEIVRANPGVDPWLPGEGKSIVVPTAFILPNAPREGVIINVAAMRIFYFPAHKPDEPRSSIRIPSASAKSAGRLRRA